MKSADICVVALYPIPVLTHYKHYGEKWRKGTSVGAKTLCLWWPFKQLVAYGIFNSSHTTNIGSGHIVATTVRWTVGSDSPSSYAAKACSAISRVFDTQLRDRKPFFIMKSTMRRSCVRFMIDFLSKNALSFD